MWFPLAQFPAVREQTSIASCLPSLVEERCQEPGTSFSGVPLLFRLEGPLPASASMYLSSIVLPTFPGSPVVTES